MLDHQRALYPLMIRQIINAERAHSTAPFVLDGEIELTEVSIGILQITTIPTCKS